MGVVSTGSEIRGADGLDDDGVVVFHAGTRRDGDAAASPMAGGCSTSPRSGHASPKAQARAYAAVDAIDWPEGFCRRDIGWRAIARETAEPIVNRLR